MKLDDLVWRTTLRRRALRDVEIGPHVFEVEDLVIPAGTDWFDGHVIGSFEIGPPWAILASFWIEAETVGFAGSDQVTLWAWGPTESFGDAYWNSQAFARATPELPSHASMAGDLVAHGAGGAITYGDFTVEKHGETSEQRTVYVGLVAGDTTEDIHVNARAAILVI